METKPYEYDRTVPWVPQPATPTSHLQSLLRRRRHPRLLMAFLTNKEETTLDQVTLHRDPPTGPTILRRVPPAGLATLPRHPSAGPASPDARHLCPRNHSQDCHWK